jgi:hypothetical protein
MLRLFFVCKCVHMCVCVCVVGCVWCFALAVFFVVHVVSFFDALFFFFFSSSVPRRQSCRAYFLPNDVHEHATLALLRADSLLCTAKRKTLVCATKIVVASFFLKRYQHTYTHAYTHAGINRCQCTLFFFSFIELASLLISFASPLVVLLLCMLHDLLPPPKRCNERVVVVVVTVV